MALSKNGVISSATGGRLEARVGLQGFMEAEGHVPPRRPTRVADDAPNRKCRRARRGEVSSEPRLSRHERRHKRVEAALMDVP